MAESEILSFSEFTQGVSDGITTKPRYYNFLSYFEVGGMLEEILKQQPHFKRFLREYPNLERKLREGIWSSDNEHRNIVERAKLFEVDLYTAYMIMRLYNTLDNDLLINPWRCLIRWTFLFFSRLSPIWTFFHSVYSHIQELLYQSYLFSIQKRMEVF